MTTPAAPESKPSPRSTFARRILANIIGVSVIIGALGVASVGAQGTQDDPAQIEAGMAIFESNCAGCHGADGQGSNAGRSLVDIALEKPDRAEHIASVTNGTGGMPAFGGSLDEDEIDAAVSYVRLGFATAQAQDDDAEGEPELAVTGRTTSSLLLVAFSALLGGVALAAASRKIA